MFGIYDPKYSRSRVLHDGFVKHGFSIIECRVDPKFHKGWSKYLWLYRLASKIKKENKIDLVIVGFPGQSIAWLARLIFGEKIVFDAFLSLYDSNVFDRKIHGEWSFAGLKDYFMDWMSVMISHKVLLDTDEHIKYFCETFGVNKDKFLRVLIGADPKNFQVMPSVKDETKFRVEFHGMFIPLQGIEYIVEAASLLKDDPSIVFDVIGHGQTFKQVKELATKLDASNINFVGQIPVEELPKYIAAADICLGIFGNTHKTGRVIPNKVYECAAMGKPIITADTPAIREVFTDQSNMVFSRTADAQDLASKIRLLRKDKILCGKVAANAKIVFDTNCRPEAIVGKLIKDLNI